MALTLFGAPMGLPPVVHHEDTLDLVEAARPSRRRTWYRRVALGRVASVIVPSRRIEALALDAWQQPAHRVRLIAPGADLAALARKPRADTLPRLIKRSGELWLGSIGALDDAGGAVALVRALAGLPEPWQLVLVGEGAARAAVRAEALAREVAHRVHLPGMLADPTGVMGLFDLLVFSGDAEPAPAIVATAMGAGLAIAAPDSGDMAEWLGEAAGDQLVPARDEAALAARIAELAADGPRRRALGGANRRDAARHDLAAVLGERKAAFAAALGQARFP
jgi:glycosyltransferase involved in cell wall biosynthesis